jgi:outer membrane protein TolC
VKFLVISNYLDVYKILNQEEVFQNNKKLAQERLKNIQKFYQQGMVTRNEVIRGELAIKNLDQGILTLKNNKKILNYNLSIALGLPTDTEIIPVESLQNKESGIGMEYYINLAHDNPLLKSAKQILMLPIKILKLLKPIECLRLQVLEDIPAKTDYYKKSCFGYVFRRLAEVSLSYNIDNLYKTKEKVKLGELQKTQANDAMTLTQQNIDMAVNAAYTKYQESIQQADILNDAKRLAEENYKITEAKYLNQLAVQAEMIDAQNQKLQSELDYANGEINVLYQYYNLLKSTGTL